jgi:lipopolysaccharide/colanic/teichoic acid biosynthesis glycosyltransferase
LQYTLEDRKRLHVKPGITCLWQIKGRSDIPFQQQVQLDMQYIRSQGIKNDIIILLKTIPAVISGKGAYCSRNSAGTSDKDRRMKATRRHDGTKL